MRSWQVCQMAQELIVSLIIDSDGYRQCETATCGQTRRAFIVEGQQTYSIYQAYSSSTRTLGYHRCKKITNVYVSKHKQTFSLMPLQLQTSTC